jgi:hypothetical protein
LYMAMRKEKLIIVNLVLIVINVETWKSAGGMYSLKIRKLKKNWFFFGTMEGFVNKIQMVYQIEISGVLLSGL